MYEFETSRGGWKEPTSQTREFIHDRDGHSDNPYLPENYIVNTVVYTGTHDNDTTRGWFEALPQNQRENVWRYLRRKSGESSEIEWELIRLAWSSVAAPAMAPLQDVLNLETEARMNLPGRVEGN